MGFGRCPEGRVDADEAKPGYGVHQHYRDAWQQKGRWAGAGINPACGCNVDCASSSNRKSGATLAPAEARAMVQHRGAALAALTMVSAHKKARRIDGPLVATEPLHAASYTAATYRCRFSGSDAPAAARIFVRR